MYVKFKARLARVTEPLVTQNQYEVPHYAAGFTTQAYIKVGAIR